MTNYKSFSLTINEHSINSKILVGRGCVDNLQEELASLSPITKTVVICEEIIPYTSIHTILRVAGGEHLKTLANITQFLTYFAKQKLDRKSMVVAIGGGALLDAVGFAASLYMRGIRWCGIPTTLLSQVDAGIGGKTGINFENDDSTIKNLIGTFWQPSLVLVDPNFLKTLPSRESIAGLAEVVKYGVIADTTILDTFEEALAKSSTLTQETLDNLITRSVEIKTRVVQEDPTEKNIRRMLNAGHTIGHAFESLSHETKTPLLHGEAVAIGLVYEMRLSALLGLCTEQDVLRVVTILSKLGLPILFSFQEHKIQELTSRMLLDKKNNNGVINFSFRGPLGSLASLRDASLELIHQVIAA